MSGRLAAGGSTSAIMMLFGRINSMRQPLLLPLLPISLLLGGCAAFPQAPTVLALPGTTKSLDQFRVDDGTCRQFANEQMRDKSHSDAVNQAGARSAATGAVVGGSIGAGIHGRHGAVAGAGTGLVIGGISPGYARPGSTYRMQQNYDFHYIQCMYAKGHRVPGNTVFTPDSARPPPPPPPPAKTTPP